jgi:hypothetical protein
MPPGREATLTHITLTDKTIIKITTIVTLETKDNNKVTNKITPHTEQHQDL